MPNETHISASVTPRSRLYLLFRQLSCIAKTGQVYRPLSWEVPGIRARRTTARLGS